MASGEKSIPLASNSPADISTPAVSRAEFRRSSSESCNTRLTKFPSTLVPTSTLSRLPTPPIGLFLAVADCVIALLENCILVADCVTVLLENCIELIKLWL